MGIKKKEVHFQVVYVFSYVKWLIIVLSSLEVYKTK